MPGQKPCTRYPTSRILLGISALCCCRLAAAEPQTLVPLNGPTVDAELISVDTTGNVIFRAAARAGAPLSLPFNQFVRWGNPVRPKPQILIVLADGGRLLAAAAWAGGVPLRLDGDSLVVLTDIWDEVRLPRSIVRGIVFAQRSHPRDRERLEGALRDAALAPPESTGAAVLLTNSDRVVGELTALSGGSLELSTAAGVVKLPLSRVEAVVLGNSRQPSAIGRQPNVVVGTSDGSVLKASRVVADDKTLAVELGESLQLSGGNVKDVVLLQSLGGAFVYLSDLDPISYRHVPYLSIEWPFRRDRNVLGEPLIVAGRQYLNGLGMHSASRITFGLDGKYRRFDAMTAIDDSTDKKGSVTFGVYVLRDSQWKSAYTSDILRGGDPPKPVSVDVDGAQALTLTIDFADRGDELDHANWLDARLVEK